MGGDLGFAYEKDRGDVEEERNQGVGQQNKRPDRIDITHRDTRALDKERNDSVCDSTCRRIIVQRDERVHLEVASAKQALNHDQAQRLGDDAADLEDEAPELELDLAKRGNHHAEDDNGHVAQDLHVWGRDAKGPGGEEDGDGCGGLWEVLDPFPPSLPARKSIGRTLSI